MDVAHQAPPSMGFFRQEYWNWLSFPSLGNRPDSGMEPGSPVVQADSLPPGPPGRPCYRFSLVELFIAVIMFFLSIFSLSLLSLFIKHFLYCLCLASILLLSS